MRTRTNRIAPQLSGRHGFLCRLRGVRAGALFVILAAFATVAMGQGQQPTAQPGSQGPAVPHLSVLLPAANRLPDANDRTQQREQQANEAKFEAANTERKRQIMQDSAELLKLAAELKAEIDKTSKDTLSLSVIRKAEDIERLARNVQTKMKLTVGAE